MKGGFYATKKKHIQNIWPELLKEGSWYLDVDGRIILNCILGAIVLNSDLNYSKITHNGA